MAHRSVRPFLQAAADFGVGVLEVHAQSGNDGLDAIFGDRFVDTGFDAAADIHLHLHVRILQLRFAHRILQEGDEIAPQRVVLGDLEGRHLEPLVPDLLGKRGHAARLDGAVFAFMDGRARPGDDLSFVEDRHHHRLIGVVGLTVAGIVDDEDIAFIDADGLVLRPVFANELDRVLHEVAEDDDAAGTGEAQVAAFGVDRRNAVAPFGARRRAHVFEHLEALVDAGEYPLADDFEANGIAFLRNAFVFISGARLESVIVHDHGIGREIEIGLAQEGVHRAGCGAGDVHVVTHFRSSGAVAVLCFFYCPSWPASCGPSTSLPHTSKSRRGWPGQAGP